MDQADVEGLAAWAYRTAGVDDDAPVSPLELARKVLRSDVPIHRFHGLRTPTALARVGEEWRIYVRNRLTPRAMAWLTAHEVAEYILRIEGYRGADVETVADQVAAALRCPRRAYLRALRACGTDWPELAAAFGTSQSSAVLRWGEVTGEPVLLVAPAHPPRPRGEPYLWPARGSSGPGIVRERLTDDTRRTVLRVA